jgi:PHD/YefM family antitoxin component YafN of YafNO toxin-antitoxin module
MQKIISATDLVRNMSRVAEDVQTSGTVYRITRGGRGSMVLVDEEYFEGWLAALDEMRRADWRSVRDETSRDIDAGRGRSLDDVAGELALEDPPDKTGRGAAPRAARARRAKGR